MSTGGGCWSRPARRRSLLTAVLALNAVLAEPRVWLIYVVGALLAAAQSLQRPSKEALEPRTVEHDQIMAASALSSLGMQVGLLAGPAVGGVLLAAYGAAWCYAVDVAALVVATALFAAMRPYPATDRSNPPSLRGIQEGLVYALRRRDLLGTYVVDIVAMFMAMPTVLFPALAADVFEQPEMLGLLYSAGTVGSLLATVTSGWAKHVHHHGRAVVIAAAAWGAAVALAGVSPSIWLVLAFLVVAGAADMISGIFRSTVWNQTIPDSMRGRLAGIEMLSYSVGPLGGQSRAGLVADAWTVRGSIASGGVLCVVGVAATALWLRDFWAYDERTDVHAARERELRAQQTA